MRRHSSTKTWQPYVAPRAHAAALRQDETLESFPDELLQDEDAIFNRAELPEERFPAGVHPLDELVERLDGVPARGVGVPLGGGREFVEEHYAKPRILGHLVDRLDAIVAAK